MTSVKIIDPVYYKGGPKLTKMSILGNAAIADIGDCILELELGRTIGFMEKRSTEFVTENCHPRQRREKFSEVSFFNTKIEPGCVIFPSSVNQPLELQVQMPVFVFLKTKMIIPAGTIIAINNGLYGLVLRQDKEAVLRKIWKRI